MTNGISEDQLSSYWVFSVLVQAHRLLSISYMWPGPVSFCYAFPSLLHSSLPPSQYSALLKHVCLCAVPTPTHAFMPNLFQSQLSGYFLQEALLAAPASAPLTWPHWLGLPANDGKCQTCCHSLTACDLCCTLQQWCISCAIMWK